MALSNPVQPTANDIPALGSMPLGIIRLVLYLSLTLVLMPVQMLLLAVRPEWANRFPGLYHRVCCRLLGMRVQIVGRPSTVRPTLFVANHASYLDIPVLSSAIDVSFVAKTEVAAWPFFGTLARLQRTVFVDRNARRQAGQQSQGIAERLAGGDNLVLFPEGTSSDGCRVLPFKSALFAAALPVGRTTNARPIVIQPVSVTCTELDGIPVGRGLRSLYAWYGDMELVPHLWRMVQAGYLQIVVEFHPPVSSADFASRKGLADHCYQRVSAGVARAVAGRWQAISVDSAMPTDQTEWQPADSRP